MCVYASLALTDRQFEQIVSMFYSETLETPIPGP